MIQSVGNWFQHSYIGEKSIAFCEVSEKYDPLLNVTRALKSFTDFAIKLPSYLHPFLQTLAQHFQTYVANINIPVDKIDLSWLEGLKPISKFLGAGRDFLTFLELPLRIKRVCEAKAWDPEKTNRFKLTSMFIQIPQKMLETGCLIPSTFGIYDLAKFCTNIGSWTGLTFVSATFVFGLKEVCVLAASIFGVIAYTLDIIKGEAKLAKKTVRKEMLEPMMQKNADIKKLATEFFKDESVKKRSYAKKQATPTLKDLQAKIKPIQDQKPALETKKAEAQKTFDDLKTEFDKCQWYSLGKRFILKRQMNDAGKDLNECKVQLKKNDDAFAKACNRYVRRYFIEKDLANKPHYEAPLVPVTPGKYSLTAPADLPDAVKERIDNVLKVVPTPEERLAKIFKYKLDKTFVQCHNIGADIIKAVYSRRFDLSKAAIVSLSLLAITGTMTIAALAPYAAAVGVITWLAVLIIGCTGFSKTYVLAYNEKAREKTLPDAAQVFLGSVAVKA